MLTPEEIYIAVTHGFGMKVKAKNLTEEIEKKRHESAKAVAHAQAKKIKEEIRKVKNPYKTMTAREAGKTPQEMCDLEVGFEDCRQKILEAFKEVGE